MSLSVAVNSTHLDDALLWLLTFRDPSNAVVLRAVNNLEDVVSNGQTYTAFPFTLTLPPDTGDKPMTLELSFPNVGLELMDLVRRYTFPNQPSVAITLVMTDDPNRKLKTIDFLTVASVVYDAQTITFSLSTSSIFARKTCNATYNSNEFPGMFFQLK